MLWHVKQLTRFRRRQSLERLPRKPPRRSLLFSIFGWRMFLVTHGRLKLLHRQYRLEFPMTCNAYLVAGLQIVNLERAIQSIRAAVAQHLFQIWFLGKEHGVLAIQSRI
jgi:lysylphosphatidylglycerol synthetase-like protein (DUF2156 family)